MSHLKLCGGIVNEILTINLFIEFGPLLLCVEANLGIKLS